MHKSKLALVLQYLGFLLTRKIMTIVYTLSLSLLQSKYIHECYWLCLVFMISCYIITNWEWRK